MQPISSYSLVNRQTQTITNTRSLALMFTEQMSTGRKSVDIADNEQRIQILDLRASQRNINSYSQSIALGLTTTAVYKTSLTGIEKIATDAFDRIRNVKSFMTGRASSNLADPVELDLYNKYQDLGQFIGQAMTELGNALNEKNGDLYLYGGARYPNASATQPVPNYAGPPVRPLTSLPYLHSPNVANNPASPAPAGYPAPNDAAAAIDTLAAATVVSPVLPEYDTDFGAVSPPVGANPPGPYPAQGTLAWNSQQLTIDTNRTVNIGITSTNSAFQDLIYGLRAAYTASQQAANYPTADRDAYIDNAMGAFSRAVDGLRTLSNQNELTDLAMQAKDKQHKNNNGVLTKRLEGLEGIDTAEVAMKLNQANTQLEASYKATATLLNMSLMNYLH